jgi:hypothetical protein
MARRRTSSNTQTQRLGRDRLLQRSLGIRDRTIEVAHADGFAIPHFVFAAHDDIAPISAKLSDKMAQLVEISTRADCCASNQPRADKLARVIHS